MGVKWASNNRRMIKFNFPYILLLFSLFIFKHTVIILRAVNDVQNLYAARNWLIENQVFFKTLHSPHSHFREFLL